MIKAIIFDMDGVLIDSEPLWKEAEIEAFAKVGLEMTIEMCNLTMGYRTIEVAEYWYNRIPWKGKTVQELSEDLIATVTKKIIEKGEILPGVIESLRFIKESEIPIALASSSPLRIINAVIEKLKISQYFQVVESAEKLEYGKPHPAVFLAASEKLNIDPTYCLVIEDSINGVIAGKAARMKVFAVPDHNLSKDPRFIIADQVLDSLVNFNDSFNNYISIMK